MRWRVDAPSAEIVRRVTPAPIGSLTPNPATPTVRTPGSGREARTFSPRYRGEKPVAAMRSGRNWPWRFLGVWKSN